MVKFSYLGDALSSGGRVQKAVIARIRCGWKKFKDTASVLCKIVVSLKLRGSMYKGCIRSVLCYGAECWALRKEDERKLQTIEMRMLSMMCGNRLRDNNSNEIIREITGVEKIEDFLREQRL